MLKNYAYRFAAALLTMLFGLSIETAAQQFPIGTYWVKANNQERFDQYDQVADCGINIVAAALVALQS